MGFADSLRARAALSPRSIVFPESGDPRVLAAVRRLHQDGIVRPIIVRDPEAPFGRDDVPSGVEVIDPATDPRVEALRDALLERRRHKGLSVAEATRLARTPLYVADYLVRIGAADGSVAGCVLTTAEVMRAAFWLIGPGRDVRTVSSAFYMAVPPFRGDTDEVLTFTDCAVLPSPSAAQLADIAIAAASDRRRIVGDVPRVAFLSFSTLGSATSESVDRIREALQLARDRRPDVLFDGELQGDAALVPLVAGRKAPASDVAGRANILVFPSLDAGNIAYKLVERLAHATAVGPIVQGLARPCNDLSRGASVDDIINVAAVTAMQAGHAAGEVPD